MRIAGILLVVIGGIGIFMCFVGVAMMARSVDMFDETFLPALVGFAAVGAGVWMVRRA